ncbi:MAG: dynamin family protein [Alphaproteobacteria bacterium]
MQEKDRLETAWDRDWKEIGSALGPLFAEARQLADRLRPFLARPACAKLDEIADGLRQAASKITVVGQVKAGKSSLVNALIRRPGLSPVSVNPWTAVVSSLHFGRCSDDGAEAIFRFFDEADWRALIGSERLESLSERLGLPVEADELATEMQAIRDRAERRLGRLFGFLLGQEHRFAKVTPDVIARYVCVGERGHQPGRFDGPTSGRFADITKSADLYFETAPFAMPATVVDTPGINDPLRVRDEQTRAALDGADVHIVVLTAQQALSTTDLSMLRLLQSLHKDRLVVFINRIDLLADVAGDARRVTEHVRRRLRQEFPDSDIEVVAGSAAWAELALTSGPAALADGLPATMTSYARELGMSIDGASTVGEVSALCSGLPALCRAIDRLLQRGPTMARLQQGAIALQALSAEIERAAANHERVLDESIDAVRAEGSAVKERRAEIDRHLEALDCLPEMFEAMAADLRTELDTIGELASRRQQVDLLGVVRTSGEEECRRLRKAIGKRRNPTVWPCDTLAVRRKLEQCFLKNFQAVARDLRSLERSALENLWRWVRHQLPDERMDLEARSIGIIDPSPSIGALGQNIAIEIGDQWTAWWRLWSTTDQRLQRLEELFVDEFEPVVDALVASAEVELNSEIDRISERFSLKLQGLTEALGQRRRHLSTLRRDLADAIDEETARALIGEYEREQQDNRKLLDTCSAISSALRKLAEGCARSPAHHQSEALKAAS